jgi:hypothetical protein
MVSQFPVVGQSWLDASESLQTVLNNGVGELSLVYSLKDLFDKKKSLFKARVKRKRGDATGARASTHSAKRITELFGDEKENETEYPSKRGPVQRAPRVLHAVECTQNDAWVSYSLPKSVNFLWWA